MREVARPCWLITFGLPALFSVLQRAGNDHLYKTTFFVVQSISLFRFLVSPHHFIKIWKCRLSLELISEDSEIKLLAD